MKEIAHGFKDETKDATHHPLPFFQQDEAHSDAALVEGVDRRTLRKSDR